MPFLPALSGLLIPMSSCKNLAAFFGILTVAALPVAAKAERVYFLLGTRHVYRIGSTRDVHQQERIEIEQNYADEVQFDVDNFQRNIDRGADKYRESAALDNDLDQLAADRDKSLASLYNQDDGLRDRHPELRIDGDGPYQVLGIDETSQGNNEVLDEIEVYEPWPDYEPFDGPYGGWVYGKQYSLVEFVTVYGAWHDHWVGGRYYGGFYGHHGRVNFRPHNYVNAAARVGHFASAAAVVTIGYKHSAAEPEHFGHDQDAKGYAHNTTVPIAAHFDTPKPSPIKTQAKQAFDSKAFRSVPVPAHSHLGAVGTSRGRPILGRGGVGHVGSSATRRGGFARSYPVRQAGGNLGRQAYHPAEPASRSAGARGTVKRRG